MQVQKSLIFKPARASSELKKKNDMYYITAHFSE